MSRSGALVGVQYERVWRSGGVIGAGVAQLLVGEIRAGVVQWLGGQ